jgi:HemK-related putative methylase
MAGVYRPAEDSMLLLRHARSRISGSVLDMGTGSGVLATAVASDRRVKRVVAVDIDRNAVEVARRRAEDSGVSGRIEFLVGDLFEGLDGERFDWILFNPPYLPSDGAADEGSWSGGETGREVVMRFLGGAREHLNPSGAILMVHSSQTGLELEEVERDYVVEVLEEMPLFFERLYCLLLRPISPCGSPGITRR